MLSFFRINDPYRLVGLLILFVLLTLPHWLAPDVITKPELHSFLVGEKITEGFTPYSDLIDSSSLLTQWMYGVVDFIAGRNLTVRHILAFIVLFFQACYLGIVFINKKAFTENTYVPSAIFVVLCIFSFDVITMTGTLLGSGFLLLAINSLFNEIEFREPKDETLLKLGFYLSLASLSSFSYIVFFVAAHLTLIFFTRASLRRHLLYFTGFLLPHALLIAWYYFQGNLTALWDFYYQPSFVIGTEHLVSIKTLLLLSAVPAFYFIVSFFVLNRAVRLTNYQTQLLQAMFLWLLAGLVQLYFTPVLRPQSLLPLFPPLSFLLAHFLLAIRRRRIAEFHLLILTLGTLATTIMFRYEWTNPGAYENLVIKKETQTSNRKILVLSEDRTLYSSSQLATGFCEWQLSKEVWNNPDNYDNVVTVHRQITNDWPSVIVDPENLLTPFLPRLPEVQAAYVKQGNNFILRAK